MAGLLPLVVAPAVAVAQGPVAWQVQAVGVATGSTFLGAGAGVRAGRRLAVVLAASAGAVDGGAAGRFEGLVTFVVNPSRRAPRVYGGGGVAVTVTDGPTEERLVLLLGIERGGSRRLGWFVEAGVGGGVRGAAGVRLRPGAARR